jgi:methanogenic corrinoid protein MtbC1
MMLLSIADEAARQAAQGRQRNIVRTYNAAAILARRLGNIMQEIGDAQQDGTTYDALEENLNEINVSRGMKSFDSIEAGMQ